MGLLYIEIEVENRRRKTKFHVFIQQTFTESSLCSRPRYATVNKMLVPALPSGAEVGPPSRVGARQQLRQYRAGEVREGFLEEVVLQPSPQEKQELAGEKL